MGGGDEIEGKRQTIEDLLHHLRSLFLSGGGQKLEPGSLFIIMCALKTGVPPPSPYSFISNILFIYFNENDIERKIERQWEKETRALLTSGT